MSSQRDALSVQRNNALDKRIALMAAVVVASVVHNNNNRRKGHFCAAYVYTHRERDILLRSSPIFAISGPFFSEMFIITDNFTPVI